MSDQHAIHVRPPAPSLTDVADNVFAYIQPDGGWCVSNSGVIASGDAALVVDTAATQDRAQRLRDAVEKTAPGARLVIVNTHHHGDHTFGNGVFGPGTPVVAHELARVEVIKAGTGLQRLWPEVDWGQLTIVPPSVTFTGRITVYVGDLRVDLIHVGPAHTSNDVVAWVPERAVLFAGDVVWSGCTPFVLMGSVAGSQEALALIRDLKPRVVVCGHGAVAGPEAVEQTASYLTWLHSLALEGISAGMRPLDAARAADLGDFACLLDAERIVGNLHRAYAELGAGSLARPDATRAVFQEMIEFNGGKKLECLA
jgi:cyclase